MKSARKHVIYQRSGQKIWKPENIYKKYKHMTSKTEYAQDFYLLFYINNSNNNLTFIFPYLISLLHATFTTLRHAKAKHILFHILFHNHYLYASILTSSSSSRSHYNTFLPLLHLNIYTCFNEVR